jgi:signal transduction histidine kinase
LADDDRQTVLELSRRLGLDPARIAERLAFFAIGAADERQLARLGEICDPRLDAIVADFYAHLLRFPPLEELLRAEPGRVAKLQDLQREYFHQLTEGRIDESYVESRLRVGNAHQRIGLRPEWYIGAFALMLRLYLRAIVEERGDGATILPDVEALIKAVFLDMSLAIDTYIHGGFVEREIAARLEHATAMAEDALHVKQETERLKDDLTSMVVHDLKNPVNGIAMMVQLALRKSAGLPEVHVGYLKQIERTCSEMMRLIQNLLEITKIEEGKLHVEQEAVAIAEIAAEVGHEYGPVAEQGARTLHVDVPDGLPDVVADRALLKRVMVNLVTNALRHSGSPEVRIDAFAEPTDEVTVRVIDRGAGLDEADLEAVFEKFRSLRRSPAGASVSDTGLGLAFCKLAIELMGGRIAVASTPGEQTTFFVTLPRRASA